MSIESVKSKESLSILLHFTVCEWNKNFTKQYLSLFCACNEMHSSIFCFFVSVLLAHAIKYWIDFTKQSLKKTWSQVYFYSKIWYKWWAN